MEFKEGKRKINPTLRIEPESLGDKELARGR